MGLYYPYSFGSGGGSSGLDEVQAIAANPRTGDVYFGGVFAGTTFTFGYPYVGYRTVANSDTTGANRDIFFGRYNRATQQVTYLTNLAGTNSYEDVYAIKVDSNDNVYVTGYFASSTLSFNGSSLTNLGSATVNGDLFVLKLDVNMNLVYLKGWGGYGWSIFDLSIDSGGTSMFMAGIFSGTFTVSGTAYTTEGSNDCAVMKLDAATGNRIWFTRGNGVMGSTGIVSSDDRLQAVALDEAAGILHCFGHFNSISLTMGSFTVAATGGLYDGLLVRVNATNGAVISMTRWGGSNNDYVTRAGIDPNTGYTYAVGYTTSTSITFAGTTVTKASSAVNSIFVASWTRTGAERWLKLYSGTANDMATNIHVHAATGNLYIAATLGSASLAVGNFTLTQRSSIFVLNSNGTCIAANALSPAPTSSAGGSKAIYVDDLNNVWFGGSVAGADSPIILGIPFQDYGGTLDAFVELFDVNLNPMRAPQPNPAY